MPPAERRAAVERLSRAGLVDDARFAPSRAAGLAARGYGDAAIRDDLERRGLDSELVAAALVALAPEPSGPRPLVARLGGGVRAARRLAAPRLRRGRRRGRSGGRRCGAGRRSYDIGIHLRFACIHKRFSDHDRHLKTAMTTTRPHGGPRRVCARSYADRAGASGLGTISSTSPYGRDGGRTAAAESRATDARGGVHVLVIGIAVGLVAGAAIAFFALHAVTGSRVSAGAPHAPAAPRRRAARGRGGAPRGPDRGARAGRPAARRDRGRGARAPVRGRHRRGARSPRRRRRSSRVRDVERREQGVADREAHTKQLQEELKAARDGQLAELERISGMTVNEAKAMMLERGEELVRHELARRVRQMEEEAQGEAKRRARNLVADALQRVAASHAAETTVTVVELPSDDMKGRIIGREGRNIRALEHLTGRRLHHRRHAARGRALVVRRPPPRGRAADAREADRGRPHPPGADRGDVLPVEGGDRGGDRPRRRAGGLRGELRRVPRGARADPRPAASSARATGRTSSSTRSRSSTSPGSWPPSCRRA